MRAGTESPRIFWLSAATLFRLATRGFNVISSQNCAMSGSGSKSEAFCFVFVLVCEVLYVLYPPPPV